MDNGYASTSAPQASLANVAAPGIYPLDSVADVAASLGLKLDDSVLAAIAGDVEFRIHKVVEVGEMNWRSPDLILTTRLVSSNRKLRSS